MRVYNDECEGDVYCWVPAKDVVQSLVDLSNDIDQYLQSDAPLECHNKDIGFKIQQIIDSVKQQVEQQTGEPMVLQQPKEANEHREGGSRP